MSGSGEVLMEVIMENILWDNPVGVATGYGLAGRSSIPGSGKRFFSSPQRSNWIHPVFCPMGTGAIFLEAKRPGHEVYSSPSRAKFKNGAPVTPLPHISSWRDT
jgi:hypothetical protein